MEMDLGTAVIGGIAFAVCFLPFILSEIARRKREKVLLRSLSSIAAQNGCRIGQHEIFGTFAIGIDDAKNFVFFYKQVEGQGTEQGVDLSEIQSCKVTSAGRTIKNKEGKQTITDRLELTFIPIAKDKRENKMEFFNVNVNGQLTGELESIEKWSKIINDRLKLKAH